MRKIVMTVATVVLLYALAVGATPATSLTPSLQNSPATRAQRSQTQTFLGTISKVGTQFVFSDAARKVSYQLDDQETASKFEGQKVKVTGTLDATNDIIRVQSIETTA